MVRPFGTFRIDEYVKYTQCYLCKMVVTFQGIKIQYVEVMYIIIIIIIIITKPMGNKQFEAGGLWGLGI